MLWAGHSTAFDREFQAATGQGRDGDPHASDGYLRVEVNRQQLEDWLISNTNSGAELGQADEISAPIGNKRIVLTLELATDDAKEKLGTELAAFTSRLAKNKGFNDSGRWLELARLLADSARAFIDNLAERVRAIDLGDGTLAAYRTAVESFLTDLDGIYLDEWAKDEPFRKDKDASPPLHWEDAKPSLDKAFALQRLAFEQSSDRVPAAPENRTEPTRDIDAAADSLPFSDDERRRWMRNCRIGNGDKAHAEYRKHPRFDGTKQREWRAEWKVVHGRERGRPKNS